MTLQVIVIMDSIWSREGMDFRMMPYNSLATASQVKFFLLLDLDQNTNLFTGWHDQGCQEHCYCLPDPEEGFDGDGAAAGRLAALQVIQRQRHATSPQRTTGTSWPRPPLKRSPTRAPATARPPTSLALGTGTPNNIIVTEDGQIFGQFLGHHKKKFGINKERVMSVLPHDFIYAISSKIKTS